MDYSLILCLAILAFYLLDLLLLLPAGEGIAYLAGHGCQARLPSWRARLGGRFALLAAPWRFASPCAKLSLWAPSAPGSLARWRAEAERYRRFYRWTAPWLALSWACAVAAAPLALWLRPGAADWLLLLLTGYLAYLAAALLGMLALRRARLGPNGAQLRLMLEALLCLPYASQLPRKLGLAGFAPLPLIDLLAPEAGLDADSAAHIAALAREQLEVTEPADARAHLQQIITLAEARQAEPHP
ncbi:hypothetical protein [Chromobacterium aquaticum]|uniref:Uncharacterized protein n=2 Tax=Chromobacterium aquaticum TaxID=467180 RepID=A0ABV8ZV48_9NEIS